MRARRLLLALPRDRKHSLTRVQGAYVATMVMVMLIVMGSQAGAYPAHVNKSCKRDYYKFCAAYSLGTPKLHRCMEAKRRSLSRRCIEALRRARMIPRRYLRR